MQPTKISKQYVPNSLPFLLQNITAPPHPPNTTHPQRMASSAVGAKRAADSSNKGGGSPQTALGSQRVLMQCGGEGEGEGREQSQLTAQQRRVVGDISRLFSSEASKPTKLLIRLNQTQVGNRGEGTMAESKLQRIEITRLDEQGEVHKGQLPTDLGSQGELLWRGSSEQDLSSASSIKIRLSEQCSQAGGALGESRQRIFGVSRQVSMMYVPELNMSTLLGMRNPPQLFSRFNRKPEERAVDSLVSNFSEDFSEKKEEAPSFVKLLEMDLFLKRKEVQQHRSEELRQANERMLATHLIDKDNIERLRGEIQQMKEKYQWAMDELRRQVEGLKAVNVQLQLEVEGKEKAISSGRQLNEQYVKENNQLKAKVKDYLKTIHHLKADLSTLHEKIVPIKPPLPPQAPITTNDRKFAVPKVLLEQRSVNDYGKACLPRSPRKEVTFNQLNQEQAINSQFYEASPYYELTERQLPPSRLEKERERERETRLANCRSQGVLSRPEPDQPESDKQRGEPTSRSQKAVGIRRNNPHTEPISPSTRNLVRVGKGGNAENSILLGEKLKDNKSLSSYSNLSGKSLSQRVGFVSKPAQADRTKGLLVDYMIESVMPETSEERVKEPMQRLQFRREQ